MALPKKFKFSTTSSKSNKKEKLTYSVPNYSSESDIDLDTTAMTEGDTGNISNSESEQNATNGLNEHDFETDDSDDEDDSDVEGNDFDDEEEGNQEGMENEEHSEAAGSDSSDEELDESNLEMDTEKQDLPGSGDELDYVVDSGPRKKRLKPAAEDCSESETDEELCLNDEDVLDDENEEVLERITAGRMKYGRTYEEDQNIRKEYINRKEELKQKYIELHYKADWIQRLDITCNAAPVAPEMQHAIEADKKIQSKKLPPLKNPFRDMSVLKDDFEREMLFQRHAQAAVLVGVPMLQDLNLYTRRNEEYLAEMVKSDKQMHKVRKNLREKLLDRQASDHARKLRKMRKFGKKVQAEVILTKAQKKKELMSKLKEYRQGQRSDLDFLDGPGRSSAADDDDVSPYVRPKRGAPAGRRGSGRGGGRGRGGRGRAEGPRMRAVLVGDGRSKGGRGRGGRGSRGNREGPNKRKQMRGGNRAYNKAKRGFTR